MRHFRDWIASYLDTVVPRSEAPERFHFWCAASTVAGVLRRRCYIEMEQFRHHPNMFVVLVGPPGIVKKSTTINTGGKLLREVEGINVGSDIVTWEAMVKELSEAEDMFANGGSRADPVRFSFTDTASNTRAITYTISEWGTFLDPENHQQINLLTEVYDGKDVPLKKITKTQGNETITAPFVNLIAGTTPDWMNDNFKGRFGGWGFSSRCIFLHCAAPERLIAYPDEMWRGQYRHAMDRLLDDLRQIAEMQGQMILTPEARDIGRAWYTTHMQRKVSLDQHPDHDPWLSYYLARKFDHVNKLSIILSASRSENLTIDAPIINEAIRRCDEVEDELSRIFGIKGIQSRTAKLNLDVWKSIENMMTKSNGGMPERAVYQWTLQYMSYGETKQFLDHFLASGVLSRAIEDGKTWYVFGPAYHQDRPQADPTTTTH